MEERKDIPWYEWLYQISNQGRVKSLQRIAKSGSAWRQFKKEKMLKQKQDRLYRRVALCKNNTIKFIFVHRLVWFVFMWLDISNKKILVCHKDDNPWNNNIENLFLGTQSDNIKDCVNKWRWVDNSNENHWMHKLSNIDVINIKELLALWINNTNIAREYGVDQSHISRIKNNISRILYT